MKPEYKPETDEEKLGYLVEECGEVLAAVGKTIRWGPECVNPELPPEEQETNQEWVLRELKDLTRAIRYVRDMFQDEGKAEETKCPPHTFPWGSNKCLDCDFVYKYPYPKKEKAEEGGG